jgi:Fur family ferric uptake transcriptional regulator
MYSEESILQQMSQAGLRITRPRRAVIRALLEDGGPLSPAEVQLKARSYCPSVGLVTVYRTLDLLSEMGLARRIHAEEGCRGYIAASLGHRHHLVCRHCGAAVEFEGCDISPFLDRVGEQTGYLIEGHLLELVGVCAACQ